MVLGRIAGLISWTSSQSLSSKDTYPYMPEALPSSSEDDNTHLVNNIRHCNSLQDLSTYRNLDLEGGSRFETYPKLWQRESASFSKQKGFHIPPVQYSKLLQKAIILLCVILFLLLTYFIVTYIASHWSEGTSKFYVVLDCGSTGTRVYVYEASFDSTADDSLPIRLKSVTDGRSRKPDGRAYDRMETEPGFHTFVGNTSGLKSGLNPLLKWAEKQIPPQSYKSTSLFLYATAGVRRLPKDDSKWLLDKAFRIMKSSPFYTRREWVQTISGPEEAYFGWVALNYRTGVLGRTPKKQTFGSLDLGGSSLQVTFESGKRVHSKVNMNLKIGNSVHYINAYSLSGYGLNDAFQKSVVRIFRESKNPDGRPVEIKHPCLHSGYKGKYTCPLCGEGLNLQLVGAPNWEECKALAKIAVNSSEWSNRNGLDCDLTPCAIPDGLPKPYGHFYGLSGFYVVYRFFNLSSDAATLDDVLDKGREFCDMKWDAAKSSVPPQPFIEQYCFRAPYTVTLLREGLNITDSQFVIGTGSITWTASVALLEAGKAFSTALMLQKYHLFRPNIHPVAVVLIFLGSILFLLCGVSFVRRSMVKRPVVSSASSVLNLQNHFRFKRWSPISSGDGRSKMPLSPMAGGPGSGLGLQLVGSGFYGSSSGSHGNLGQVSEGNAMSTFVTPRGQMRLQSRRSQSREDLNSTLAEVHVNF